MSDTDDMWSAIKEFRERIEGLEKEAFGMTRAEARKYLDDAGIKQRTMSPERYDNWCSLNVKTVERAERCVGA